MRKFKLLALLYSILFKKFSLSSSIQSLLLSISLILLYKKQYSVSKPTNFFHIICKKGVENDTGNSSTKYVYYIYMYFLVVFTDGSQMFSRSCCYYCSIQFFRRKTLQNSIFIGYLINIINSYSIYSKYK